MSKYSFSIVMPNYNKEQYIAKSIESVLLQDYSDFELIIVDDGSTDNSVRIISQFKDDRIRVISQANAGVSAARNKGILNAKHELIAFLDSDDIWFPWFLSEMHQMIMKYPMAGAYGCNYCRIPYSEEVYMELLKANENNDSEFELIDSYFSCVLQERSVLTASTSVVKKEIFKCYGLFPEGLKCWEDFDMWLRIGLYSTIVYNAKVCSIYNAVSNSASSDRSNLFSPVLSNYAEHIEKSGITGKRKKDFLKLVATKEAYAAYEQYLIDHKKQKALKRVLPFWRIELFNKLYWSEIIQIIVSPERFQRFLQLIRFRDKR